MNKRDEPTIEDILLFTVQAVIVFLLILGNIYLIKTMLEPTLIDSFKSIFLSVKGMIFICDIGALACINLMQDILS